MDNVSDTVMDINTPELADGEHPAALLDTLPPGMEETCAVVLLTDGRTMAIELRFPEGTVLDEKNPAHVLAWYIAKAAPDLLVAAVNSWHLQRHAVARAQASANEEPGLVQDASPALLGADGKPIGGA
jgi:hypothetical protein